jgi:purine-binding chemotaxis protein CheW
MSERHAKSPGKALKLPESGTAEEILALLGQQLPSSSEQILEFADLTTALGNDDAGPRVERSPFLLFQMGDEHYAIPLGKVIEILRVEQLTRVPGAPPHVRGVMNVRGRILPVVELRTRITLPSLVLGETARVIVVEASGRKLGILVDAVSDILRVASEDLSPPPSEVMNDVTDYVSAVGNLDGRVVLVVDLERALRLPASTLAKTRADNEQSEGTR